MTDFKHHADNGQHITDFICMLSCDGTDSLLSWAVTTVRIYILGTQHWCNQAVAAVHVGMQQHG